MTELNGSKHSLYLAALYFTASFIKVFLQRPERVLQEIWVTMTAASVALFSHHK